MNQQEALRLFEETKEEISNIRNSDSHLYDLSKVEGNVLKIGRYLEIADDEKYSVVEPMLIDLVVELAELRSFLLEVSDLTKESIMDANKRITGIKKYSDVKTAVVAQS